MTLRAGYSADPSEAVCLHKIVDGDDIAAGILLVGFGTLPLPGAIAENAIHAMVHFVSHHLQETLESLMQEGCRNLDYAKSRLHTSLERLNDLIYSCDRRIGQGTYLRGVVFYTVSGKFICLPFGGGYAALWQGGAARALTRDPRLDIPGEYIWDAIGGCAQFTTDCAEGEIPAGTHLICLSDAPPGALLSDIMAANPQSDPALLARAIFCSTERGQMPRAALILSQHLDIPQHGGDST